VPAAEPDAELAGEHVPVLVGDPRRVDRVVLGRDDDRGVEVAEEQRVLRVEVGAVLEAGVPADRVRERQAAPIEAEPVARDLVVARRVGPEARLERVPADRPNAASFACWRAGSASIRLGFAAAAAPA
jgi:hypothetical protein